MSLLHQPPPEAARITSADHAERALWHAVPCHPWAAGPFRLVSLWDMLEFDAHAFIRVLLCIGRCRDISRQLATQRVRQTVGDSDAKYLRSLLDEVDSHSQQLALDSAQGMVCRIQEELTKGCDDTTLDQMLLDLQRRIEDQLRQRLFLYMPMDKVPYYQGASLLGSEVDAKFPEAIEDIAEAGKSFALARYTACVFHLMRVMERAVQSFGGKLGVPKKITGLREWGRILEAANKRIDAIRPKSKHTRARKEAYAEAWAFLDRVRLAWRNKTMHPKATYTEDEAREIFDSVKAFMGRLAKLV